jgi:hypothetical protein
MIRPAPCTARALAHPLDRAGLPLFFALAFLPSLLRLASFGVVGLHPLLALGPVAAGAWFAARHHENQVRFVLLGTGLATLLWAVNWLMLAGDGCCSFR